MTPTELKQLQEKTAATREEWRAGITQALDTLTDFAYNLERALDTISRDEAVDALKLQAAEVIEALR